MDKKFLHKVLDQLVRETEIDYDRKVIETPFFIPPHIPLSPPYFPDTLPSFHSFFFHPFSFLSFFLKHCKDVYGLNREETMYVWKEYIKIIKDKINSNE
tara:strand:- start:465 stop:761 length:297 start_codon:yes stop_codon:yes gene_type:complete